MSLVDMTVDGTVHMHHEVPSLSQVIGAIERIDGEFVDMVTLKARNGIVLYVCGGPRQLFVSAELPDNWFKCPILSDNEDLVMLSAGGQEGEYDGRYVGSISQIVYIAEAFFHLEELTDQYVWIEV